MFDYNVYQMKHAKKFSFSNSYSALDPLSPLAGNPLHCSKPLDWCHSNVSQIMNSRRITRNQYYIVIRPMRTGSYHQNVEIIKGLKAK